MAQKLTDIDDMPFGMYKGKKMQDIPVTYLHWLWHQGKENGNTTPVLLYIKSSIDALKLENKDLIWDMTLHRY